MSVETNKNTIKRNRSGVVNMTKDWRAEITTIAGPMLPTDTMQSWFYKVVKRSGLKLRQVEELYHGRCKDPKYSVAEKIIAAADQARILEAQKMGNALADTYVRCASTLRTVDEDFHRISIDALISAARHLGNTDRT